MNRQEMEQRLDKLRNAYDVSEIIMSLDDSNRDLLPELFKRVIEKVAEGHHEGTRMCQMLKVSKLL
jgi:hypothetical protein